MSNTTLLMLNILQEAGTFLILKSPRKMKKTKLHNLIQIKYNRFKNYVFNTFA